MKRAYLLAGWLCAFFAAQSQSTFTNCPGAFAVCSHETIVFDELAISGEAAGVGVTSCYRQDFPETHSAWIKWQVASAGKLGFTIVPLDEHDDLDFVLYRLPGGWDECGGKEEVRCMASGKNFGEEDRRSSEPCTGATGLSLWAVDRTEMPGCREGDDNFLSAVDATAGETYVLFVNNYLSANGFMLEFTGDATFSQAPAPCATSGEEDRAVLNGILDEGLTIGDLYPNPAGTTVTAVIESGRAYDGQAEIIDLRGRVLKIRPVGIVPGAQPVSIPVDELHTGVYFLKIRLGDNLHVARFGKL